MKRWRYLFPLLLDDRAKGDSLVAHLRATFQPQTDAPDDLVRFYAGFADLAEGPVLWVNLDYRGETSEALADRVAHDIADEISSRGLGRRGSEPVFRRLLDDGGDVDFVLPEWNAPLETGALRLWMDPGDAPSEVVADVLRALSDLHAAAGGSGLHYSVDEDGSLIVAPAEELV